MSFKYLHSEGEVLTNALGTELLWGWSPAYSPLDSVPLAAEGQNVNVLLMGAGDIRHVMRVLASLRTRPYPNSVTTHIYIHEPNLRTHARSLFFLQLILGGLRTPAELEEITKFFLEVYGNTLLRQDEMEQVKQTAQKVLRYLGYEEGPLEEIMDLSLLKSKERDFIEEQVKAWSRVPPADKVTSQWDSRLRTELAERYDVRDNILDYDYHMRFKEYTPVVRWPEYKTWRLTGVAYDYARVNPRRGHKYEYSTPNPTLLLYPRNEKLSPSYCGDIVVGPYVALAGETPNVELRKYSFDGTLKMSAGVVAMHNVRGWLFEMYTGVPWKHEGEHLFAWDDEKHYNVLPNPFPETFTPPVPSTSNVRVKIHLLGLEGLDRLFVQQPDLTFHHVFSSVGSQSLLGKVLPHLDILATVVVETAKFCIQVEETGKQKFMEIVKEVMKPWGEVDEAGVKKLMEMNYPPHGDDNDTPATQRARKCLASPHALVFTRKVPPPS